jgi:hypothetical protein
MPNPLKFDLFRVLMDQRPTLWTIVLYLVSLLLATKSRNYKVGMDHHDAAFYTDTTNQLTETST